MAQLGSLKIRWGPCVNVYETLLEVIDMRSFSNLWYWIVLAVVWSGASHWVLGVPYDMIQRARRGGDGAHDAMGDLEDLVGVLVRRMLLIGQVSGLWVLGFICFTLSALAILAFWYGVEFAQAVFLLAFPLTLVGGLALSTARKIVDRGLEGEGLIKALLSHRFWTQVVGIIAIFVTAMWGMYQNLLVGVI